MSKHLNRLEKEFLIRQYDNRSKGEVDYLIDDYDSLSTVPIEVKSGKDYAVYSALNTFVKNDDYPVKKLLSCPTPERSRQMAEKPIFRFMM